MEQNENQKQTHKIVYQWSKIPIMTKGVGSIAQRMLQKEIFDAVTVTICMANKIPKYEFKNKLECSVYKKGTYEQCLKELDSLQSGNIKGLREVGNKLDKWKKFISFKRRSVVVPQVKPTHLEKLQNGLAMLFITLDVTVEELDGTEA